MAKKKPRLFVDDGSSYGTVILNWHGKPEEEFGYMAEAFHDAAKDAIKKLKRNRHFGIEGIPLEDFRAYPAIFLYRHALELSMKAILMVGTKMLALKGEPQVDRGRLLSRHDLDWLRTEVERVFIAYGWGWDCGNKHFGSVKDLRDVIGEFHNIDAGSYAFRYPLTAKGKAALKEDFRFNVFHFAKVLDGLFPTLKGAAIGVHYEYEDALQALGEAQEEERRYEAENFDPGDYDPGDYEPYDEE
jgi:hypothetical protein